MTVRRTIEILSLAPIQRADLEQKATAALQEDRGKVRDVTYQLTSHGDAGLAHVLGSRHWVFAFSDGEMGCANAAERFMDTFRAKGRTVQEPQSQHRSMQNSAGTALKLPGQR